MIRNKIEKWIISQNYVKHRNLIFMLILCCSIILITTMLLYIKYSN